MSKPEISNCEMRFMQKVYSVAMREGEREREREREREGGGGGDVLEMLVTRVKLSTIMKFIKDG